MVVDPGDEDQGHLERVAGHGPVALVLLTHRHHDQRAGRGASRSSPARRCGARPSLVLGSEALGEGDVVAAPGASCACGTPGHTSDSLSFLLVGLGANPRCSPATRARPRHPRDRPPDGAWGPTSARCAAWPSWWTGRTCSRHGPELPDAPSAARHCLAHREERLEQVRTALESRSAKNRPAGRRARLHRRRQGAVGRGGAGRSGAAAIPARLIRPARPAAPPGRAGAPTGRRRAARRHPACEERRGRAGR